MARKNKMPCLTILQSAVAFRVWRLLDTKQARIIDHTEPGRKWGKAYARNLHQVLCQLWVKGIFEREIVKIQKSRTIRHRFAYKKGRVKKVEVQGWGKYFFGEKIPLELKQAQEEALTGPLRVWRKQIPA